MGTTVQVEQGRWNFLDSRLLNAGAAVNLLTAADVQVAYKKYGSLSFSIKPINGARTTLALGSPTGIGDTSVTLDNSSIFPRTSGTLILDPDGGSPEIIDFTSNNTGTGVLAVPSGVLAVFAGGTTVQFSHATALSATANIGDTTLYVDDTSIFPPDFGKVKLYNVANSEEVEIDAVVTAANQITLKSALTIAFAIDDKVELVEWYPITANSPGGYYSTLFAPSDLDTLDPFYYAITQFSVTAFDTFDRTIEVVPAASAESESAGPFATCVLKDNVVDLQGNPVQNISISARMLAVPGVSQGTGISDQVVSATTDANGFFQLTILQTATVDIVIPKIGYRRTLVVPSTTAANLFEV